MSECRETLDQAIKIRTFYRDNIKLVTDTDPSKLSQVEAKMDHFERDLKAVLQVSQLYCGMGMGMGMGMGLRL